MAERDDIKFMKRCIELAAKAEGMTYPNPMVGSVIVIDGVIVGEGYHRKAGGPHAEVIAIGSVRDKAKLNRATLYVNLEPCSHFGKTPPCADLIISCSIPRVVIGTIDTSKKVSGEGIKKLKNAGCKVTKGVCEAECRWLNRRFFTFHEKKRPYITLKWAQSSDGYIDVIRTNGHRTEPTWITGNSERVLVHKWRASEESILVGAGTIRADNPLLNVREWKGSDPIKIILSGSGEIENDISINQANNKVILFTHNLDKDIKNVHKVMLDKEKPSSLQISKYLYNAGIQSLFIEGGAQVLNHFISSGLWDEARVFAGDKLFSAGIKAPVIKGSLLSHDVFSGSILNIYLEGTS